MKSQSAAFRIALQELNEELAALKTDLTSHKALYSAVDEFLRSCQGWRGFFLRGPLANLKAQCQIFKGQTFAHAESRMEPLGRMRDSLEEAERALNEGAPLRIIK